MPPHKVQVTSYSSFLTSPYNRLNDTELGPKTRIEVRTNSAGTPYGHRSYAPKFGSTPVGTTLKIGIRAAARFKTAWDVATFGAAAVGCEVR